MEEEMIKDNLFKRVIEYLFGFGECAKCENFSRCDRKPYLFKGTECNYNKIHNRE